MARYAAKTEVAADRSRQEIERELVRFGASGFGYSWQDDRAMVEFLFNGRRIRLTVDLPLRESFNRPPKGSRGWNAARANDAWEQAKKQRWRALALVVKAKLVAVTDKIRTFEHEFGMDIVMPDNRTVAEHVLPKVEQAYLTGATPLLLPAATEANG